MKLIYIEWEDAFAMGNGWHTEEDIDETLKKNFIVRETGYVYDENDKYLVIASQYAPESEQYGNITKIPKTWIRKRKTIKL